MQYSFKTIVKATFEEVLERTKEELTVQGFAIVSELDIQEVLRRKLGITYTPYTVLGACVPAFAHEALQAEKDVGLFLPCNVVVYTHGREVFVAALAPTAATNILNEPKITAVAEKMEARLQQLIATLANEESKS